MSETIRHLAAAEGSPTLAAALFERKVYVWNTESGSIISEFDTELDFGGDRMALSHSGAHLFVGSFESRTLYCHDTSSGRVLWRLPDIGGIQTVLTAVERNRIVCGIAGPQCLLVDPVKARVDTRYDKTEWLIEDGIQGNILLVGNPMQLRHASGTTITIPRETFAVLAACFGEGIVAVSESGGSVRCLSVENGSECWRYLPPNGHHVLGLMYLRGQRRFCGIEWHYERSPGYKYILGIDAVCGRTERIVCLESLPAFAFSHFDGLLYTHEGLAIDVCKGEVVKRLPFADVIS